MGSFCTVHPLYFGVSSVHYPMSSVERPKNRGQKCLFFAPIFAHFSFQNHNILWLSLSIFACHHNTSSVSPSPHAMGRKIYTTWQNSRWDKHLPHPDIYLKFTSMVNLYISLLILNFSKVLLLLS